MTDFLEQKENHISMNLNNVLQHRANQAETIAHSPFIIGIIWEMICPFQRDFCVSKRRDVFIDTASFQNSRNQLRNVKK